VSRGDRPDGSRSRTHERAVLEQDNGELAEDVLATRALDRADVRVGGGADEAAAGDEGAPGDELDEQGKASFPASDPPASWSGAPSSGRDGGRHGCPRVERNEVEHPAERNRPDDPVPKTLRRDPASRRRG
jgi:hypothetical protein